VSPIPCEDAVKEALNYELESDIETLIDEWEE
jgi:hypothetical protein